ncbi:cell division protein ZapA [Bacillus alkalicellulosilyticus]|uniref:cell division protein ZapA n=1 Tax=Alkalihalobacterium alkalicellulosilyticum TaxID=1912214 RepID=UPI001FE6DC48|nr:cell division protein ZapA [Bacillus alkalicellulosilyticus]
MRTTVSIYGQQYRVLSEEDPSHVTEVANVVDAKMRAIKKNNPYLDTTRLAVLTAVNIVDEYLKLQEKVNQLENQKKEENDG